VRVRRTFRVYASAEDGAHDYVLLLAKRHRRARRAAERGSPIDFVTALADGDYFTHDSEQYRRSVSSLTLEYLRENPEPASGTRL
jgi:flagellum-specific peptidoglycan hydrolase FlgJ